MASIQALRMIKALVRLGWMVARASGSHHVLAKPGCPRLVIPVHRGKPFKEGFARHPEGRRDLGGRLLRTVLITCDRLRVH